MEKKPILAKDIVKRFNLSYHTVNYYTAIGLLPVLAKKGNSRLYDEEIIRERLSRILQMIAEGYPLRLIRKKIEEPR